jgi:hypothetical protein
MSAEMHSFLFGFVGMLLGVLGAILAMGRMFVTKNMCQQYHDHAALLKKQEDVAGQEWRKNMVDQLACLNHKSDVQFKMLRSIVTYMDIDPTLREKILNGY